MKVWKINWELGIDPLRFAITRRGIANGEFEVNLKLILNSKFSIRNY